LQAQPPFSIEPINPAERILSRQDEIHQARKAAEEKLAEAKDLEKQWQAKQAEMDQALKALTLSRMKLMAAILSAGVIFQTGDTNNGIRATF
jgi:endonuclease III